MMNNESSSVIRAAATTPDLEDRERGLRRAGIGGAVIGLLFALLSFVAGSGGGWPFIAIGIAGMTILLSSLAGLLLGRDSARLNLAVWTMLIGQGLSLPVLAGSISGSGVLLAIAGGLLLPSMYQPALSQRHGRRALGVSLGAGVLALLIDLYNPAGRLALPIPTLVVLALDAVMLSLAGVRIARGFPNFDLRTKLVLAFMTVSLIPLMLLTFLSDRNTRVVLEREVNSKLLASAEQTANALDTFITSRLAEIETLATFGEFEQYISMPASQRNQSESAMAISHHLNGPTVRSVNPISSIGLLNLDGRVLIDTDADVIGRNEADAIYFQQALDVGVGVVSPPQVSSMESGEASIYFSRIVEDSSGQTIGVLRARYPLAAIQDIVSGSAELAGEDSFVVVFDEYQIHIAHSSAPETIMQAVGPLTEAQASELIAAHRLPDLSLESLSTNLPELEVKLAEAQENPFFEAEDVATGDRINQVAVASMEQLPWQVAFFQPQDVLFAPVTAQARSSLLLAVVLSALVAAVALAIAQLVSRPITELTNIARRISDGELEVVAPESSRDELGMLASTFNSMTSRLRSLISGLEDRVNERTSDLERRASQLQAASEVAKGAASVRDVDRVLKESVTRISEQFGYHHAAVFLLDEQGDFAELRAASSPGGQRMLARGHKLAVGKVGLVGYVTGTGKPRLAGDVSEDSVHVPNPDLPDTQSELALPLLIGDDVIGSLDVQSVDRNAFDDQDVVALQTMADQLAIALDNARLLSRQTELADDRRRAIDVYRQLTGSMSYDQILADVTRLVRSAFDFDRATLAMVEGNDVIIRSASARSQERLPRLGESVPVGQGLLGRAASIRQPVVLDETTGDGGNRIDPILGELGASLCVPLISRGQAIGVLAVERKAPATFDENDIELIELLASQAAVSIENARLFEETQQRLRQVDTLYRRQTAEAWELLVNARRVQGQENLAAFGETDQISRADDSSPIEAPISLRGEVIGRLNVLPQQQEDWTEEDLEILRDVADEVAGQLEQLRLVEEIQRRATQLETAAEIARVATGLLDLDQLLKRAVNLIRDRFGFYHVAVYLVEEGGQTAFIREGSGDVGDALKQTRRRFEIDSRSVIGFVTGAGEYYVAHDTETDPYFKPSNLLPESRSELAVPLKIGERVIGALDVHDDGRYAFGEDDITVLETLADQVAVAVENARLFQEALERAEREQSVVSITSKIRASHDIDEILRTAVQEMRQALGAGRATIRLSAVPAESRDNGSTGSSSSNGSDRSDEGQQTMESEPEQA